MESFSGDEKLSRDEAELCLELDEEFSRRGNFERLFPLGINSQHYSQFFEHKRYANALLSTYVQTQESVREKLFAPKIQKVHFNSYV